MQSFLPPPGLPNSPHSLGCPSPGLQDQHIDVEELHDDRATPLSQLRSPPLRSESPYESTPPYYGARDGRDSRDCSRDSLSPRESPHPNLHRSPSPPSSADKSDIFSSPADDRRLGHGPGSSSNDSPLSSPEDRRDAPGKSKSFLQ